MKQANPPKPVPDVQAEEHLHHLLDALAMLHMHTSILVRPDQPISTRLAKEDFARLLKIAAQNNGQPYMSHHQAIEVLLTNMRENLAAWVERTRPQPSKLEPTNDPSCN